MANDEHVALLRKGVAAWNAWRRENPDIHPNLAGASLSGVDSTKYDLRGAVGANLSDADLSRARLHKSNFFGADLTKADLRRANFSGADLSGLKLGDLGFQLGDPAAPPLKRRLGVGEFTAAAHAEVGLPHDFSRIVRVVSARGRLW
jgi:hypothetical protein